MDKPDWKELYRRVKNKPQFMYNDRPSSALFKDSKGVSVNRDGNRNKDEIIADEKRLYKLYNKNLEDETNKLRAIISLRDIDCISANVYVLPDPIEGENPFHALIQKSETEIVLGKSQAKQLAKAAKFVEKFF